MKVHWVQTRSDSHDSRWAGTPAHETIKEGFEAAKSDETTWKVSFCATLPGEDDETYFRFLRVNYDTWGKERKDRMKEVRPDLFDKDGKAIEQMKLWAYVPILTGVIEEVLTEEEFEEKYCN